MTRTTSRRLASCREFGRRRRDPGDFFELKVRPVLVTNCLPCHGGKKTSSGLKVNSRDPLCVVAAEGRQLYRASPGKSLLIQAVRRLDDDLKMPPIKIEKVELFLMGWQGPWKVMSQWISG